MNPNHRPIVVWLFGMCVAILVMIAIGGITRLTESGLSIVKWEPFMGAVPPMNEAQWNERFDQYKAYPEYRVLKPDMTMSEFKMIYFWEWFHRLWGRLLGVFFLLPFLGFLAVRLVDRRLGWRLGLAFLLGGLQGALGWFMVKSGLVDIPRVSHFRLAAHLLLAMLLFGYLYWLALDLMKKPKAPAAAAPLRPWSLALLALLVLQIAYGAFTAGLDAGYQFNTFPKMMGHWIAPGIFSAGFVESVLHNPGAIQFVHRTLGWILAFGVIAFWIAAVRRGFRGAPDAMLILTVIQFLLGVFTLLLEVQIAVAVAHQVNAALLLGAVLATVHRLRPAAAA